MLALRNLVNRMLGQLHHCLQPRTPFDEAVAFPLGGSAAVRPGRAGHLIDYAPGGDQ